MAARKAAREAYAALATTYGELPQAKDSLTKFASQGPAGDATRLTPAELRTQQTRLAADPLRKALEAKFPRGGTVKDLLDFIESLRNDPGLAAAGAANKMEPLDWMVLDKLRSIGGELDRATFSWFQPGDRYRGNARPNWAGVSIYPQNPAERIQVIFRDSAYDARRAETIGAGPLVLHELVHVATQVRLEAGLLNPNASAALRDAADAVDRLLRDTRAALRQMYPSGAPSFYGLTDAHEFLAEAMSDRAFQTLLKSIPVAATAKKPTTLWGRFTDAVAALLGFTKKDENALTQAYARFEQLLDASSDLYAREAYWDYAGVSVKAPPGVASVPSTPEQLALDEALRKLRELQLSVMDRVRGRSAAAQLGRLRSDARRAEQAVTDTKAAISAAEASLQQAQTAWKSLMSRYVSETTGDLRDAFDSLLQNLPESGKVQRAQQIATTAEGQLTQLAAQRTALVEAEAKLGLRIPTALPQGFAATTDLPTVNPTRVFYVAASDLAGVTADNIESLATLTRPKDGYALVAIAPDGTVTKEAVRFSLGPVSPLRNDAVDAAMDYLKYNPPTEPTGKLKLRELETWERALWTRFRAATAGLPEEKVLEAAMLTLRDAPVATRDTFGKAIPGVTPQTLGKRYGDIDPAIRPLVEEMNGLLKAYERMFVQHGLDFIADPLRMLKDWGVNQYIPHIPVSRNMVAAGKLSAELLARGVRNRPAGFAALDSALSTDMPQRHERRLAGTVAEIMSVSNDPLSALTLDPASIISRYTKANGALTAQDFLVMMLRGGVIKALKATPDESVVQVAMREQMVPLFSRPNLTRDLDLLFGADAAAWAAANVDAAELDVIRATIRAWSEGTRGTKRLKDISPFASWIGEVPAVQQAINIEELLLDIRSAQWRKNGAAATLLNIRDEFDAAKAAANAAGASISDAEAWKTVSSMVNRLAAEVGSEIRVDPKMLNAWFDGGQTSWQLYVPATVAQNMLDTLDFAATMERSLEGMGGMVKSTADKINNFYKGWYTITQMMHHVGNAIGNIFNNALDLGPLGALNPKTNLIATQLTHAAAYVDEYGSLMKAAEALEAPKHATESAWDYARRKARLQSFRAMGIAKLLDTGIDLGDGVFREADTAMRLMRERGVFTGGHNVYLDLDRYEQEMAEVFRLMNQPEAIQKLQRAAVGAGNAVILTLPIAFTGSLAGLGVVIPPSIGRMISGFVENQARVTNFVANMRRSGSVDASVQHMNKFLFNYADLTAVQKTWLRTVFPFFTWTFKNAYLQAGMMLEQPMFYQLFNQMLLIHGPRAVAAYERDIDFKGRFPAHPWKRYSVNWRLPHARYRLRIPVPERPTLYLEGFRTPFESAAETLGQVASFTAGIPGVPATLLGQGTEAAGGSMGKFRIMSQMHFAARFLFEKAFDYNVYYDRPLYQLDSAKPVGQTLAALYRTSTSGVPFLAPMAAQVHNALARVSGYAETTRYNPNKNTYEPVQLANPGFAHTFMNMPYSQLLRTLIGASDVYQTSMAESLTNEAGVQQLYTVPQDVRYFDALTGIGLTQEDPIARIKMVERDARDMQLRAMEAGGGVLSYEKPFISKR